VFETFDGRQGLRVDLVQPAQIARQGMGLALHRMYAEIFEQIVVRVDTIERRVGRMRLVQVPKQIVDKMREWFGSNHESNWAEVVSSDPPMVQ
jgi:hypothetical protein